MKATELSKLRIHAKALILEYINSGHTINSLAVKAGIQPIQISQYLENKRGLTDDTLEKIGKALIK